MTDLYSQESIQLILESQSSDAQHLDIAAFSAIFGNVSESYKSIR